MKPNFWQTLPKPFYILAPMEAVTDVVFRHVVAHAARPDVFFTEFTNASSYCSPAGIHSTRTRLAFTPDEHPMVAQIWGNKPEQFAEMGKGLAEMDYAGIDINMGCPHKAVVKGGAGSALIQQPKLAAELIAAAKTSGLPVSVKTRLGYSSLSEWEAWLTHVLSQDIANLTIHLRTRKEMSKVPAHYDYISRIVELRNQIAPQTLVTINGDIADRAHGKELAATYGVDGIMIGRGIFANPYAFEVAQQHSREELVALLRRHLDLFDHYVAELGPRPYDPLKRFFKIYIREFDGAHELRSELMNTRSTEEARKILDTHLAA